VARLCGACCGLMVFSVTILAGLLAGNPIEKITLRSVAGLAGGYLLGCAAAWIAFIVVNDKPNEPTPIADSSESQDGNGQVTPRPSKT
jgi:hypothetical protein